MRAQGAECSIRDLQVTDSRRATTVSLGPGGPRVSTVEHLFAALDALGLLEGVVIDVEGGELPLLDGGAKAYGDALARLGAPCAPRRLRVAREAELAVGESVYGFSPAPVVRVEVTVDFSDPRVHARASWDGSALDFAERIAPARTFARSSDLVDLADAGLARHVDPESVVLIGDEILCAGRPFSADEPARHKLLDLVGDAAIYGGVPVGALRVLRPGHRANHEALSRARRDGILVEATCAGA